MPKAYDRKVNIMRIGIDIGGTKESVDSALEAICQQFINNPKYVPVCVVSQTHILCVVSPKTRNKYNPQASLFPNYMYPMHLFGSLC